MEAIHHGLARWRHHAPAAHRRPASGSVMLYVLLSYLGRDAVHTSVGVRDPGSVDVFASTHNDLYVDSVSLNVRILL